MKRKVKTTVKGFIAIDGAGVSLVRVLGRDTVEEFDPILMLDSFDSINPVSYTHLTLPTIHYKCRSRWSPYH